MWHWDQGHLAYFDFDKLRAVSQFALNNDLLSAKKSTLHAAVGLSFAAPPTHSAWRQYGRVFKMALLVSESSGVISPTDTARVLATPGAVTCDEYLHFLAQVSTEPSPALEAWEPAAQFRYPLLFSLRYLLSKVSSTASAYASLDEIIGAYRFSNFVGDEDDTAFLTLGQQIGSFESLGQSAPDNLRRQAKESLKVISQISYLHVEDGLICVNLAVEDARIVFQDLNAIGGPRASTGGEEIRRLAKLFKFGSTQDFFSFPNTVISDLVESGFIEGNKVQKTHVTIERNSGLRAAFFTANPTTICDVCSLDTHASYPWSDRVLDVHHLLPLSSGTRVIGQSTTLDDLVPLCPSCHRAVHRYYSRWFGKKNRKDFAGRDEAVAVYAKVKSKFPGYIHA